MTTNTTDHPTKTTTTRTTYHQRLGAYTTSFHFFASTAPAIQQTTPAPTHDEQWRIRNYQPANANDYHRHQHLHGRAFRYQQQLSDNYHNHTSTQRLVQCPHLQTLHRRSCRAGYNNTAHWHNETTPFTTCCSARGFRTSPQTRQHRTITRHPCPNHETRADNAHDLISSTSPTNSYHTLLHLQLSSHWHWTKFR